MKNNNKKNQKTIGMSMANIACNLGSNDFFDAISSDFHESVNNATANISVDNINMNLNEDEEMKEI